MNENIKCEMVGMLNDEISKHQFECTRRVYGTDGLCPTLVVCGGGGQNTKIIEPAAVRMVQTEDGKKLRKAYESGQITHGFNEHRKAEPRTDGITGAITTVEKDSMVFEPTSCAIRGRKMNDKWEQQLEIGGEESNSLTTVEKDSAVIEPKVRIRYLTERERFRLMGVHDEDFERVAKNQSRSSLCHLSGDSIVVDVLMRIFAKMKSDG